VSQRSGGVKSEGAMAVNEAHGWKNKKALEGREDIVQLISWSI
jgi:hypothetical protein